MSHKVLKLLFIFVLFMKLKNHIALLFVIIFLGKLVTMDAKFLGVFLDSNGVTLVNKMCKKKSHLSNASEDVSTATLDQSLEMDFLCHTVFDHKIAQWGMVLSEVNFRQYQYTTPGLFSTPREKFYPPPKA